MAKRPQITSLPRPVIYAKKLVVPKELMDDNYHYRWIDRDPKSGRIEYAQELGYEFVTKGDVKGDTKGVGTDGIPGNAVTTMDVVLMRCSKADFIARRKQLEAYNKARVGQPIKQFKNKARSMGVEVGDTTREQDSDELENDEDEEELT